MNRRAGLNRCPWAGPDPLYIEYHDTEWGVPVRDDRLLFEFLVLEGAQAGISWLTVLRKRQQYRKVFSNFDIERVAGYDDSAIETLLQDPGIIRNRLKVRSAVTNSRAVLNLQKQHTSLSDFLWSFVQDTPKQNHWQTMDEVPSRTPESDRMSLSLKKAGFSFVGSTICYAFMQAVGMVNDHLVDCFRHEEVRTLSPHPGSSRP
ncbi:MAG: DNA-3-methyladenine glycosylase I [Desulfovibrionales bacterium]